jgi:hypothetical protein
MNLDRQAWIDCARAVPTMHEIERRRIKLKRVGAEYIGPCPLCGGTDRFSVNANKKVWNCRGCGIGGDVIDLVQHLDGGTFDQNIATLAGPLTTGKSNGKHHSAEPRPIVVVEYLYHDENGVVLFGVDRIHYQNADGTFVMKDGKYQKSLYSEAARSSSPRQMAKGGKGQGRQSARSQCAVPLA